MAGMSEWQDIATAPRDGTPLVLKDRYGHEFEGRWLYQWRNWRDEKVGGIIKWMPLPPATHTFTNRPARGEVIGEAPRD